MVNHWINFTDVLQHTKHRAKQFFLSKLHAKEIILSQIATKVAYDGVRNFLTWDYEKMRDGILGYVRTLRGELFDYRFAASTSRPVLYASFYAFQLRSMLGDLPDCGEIDAWIDHFDAHQAEDGLFRDTVLASPAFEGKGDWGEGWGARHLTAHIVIAYARAGRRPPRPFRFLEPFHNANCLEEWLAAFNFTQRIWPQSNYVMNAYSLLQFARDHMDEPQAERAIRRIGEWLFERQNSETGLWHTAPITSRAQANDAIRGAYHFYPLFEYEGWPIPYQERAIDVILDTQNSWGAFEEEDRPAGACEDFDALDPLLRFTRRTGHRLDEARLAAQRSMVWLMACHNLDGGYVSLLENGCHYGNHPETTSRPAESNLFATWFRTLTLAYVTDFLGLVSTFRDRSLSRLRISTTET